MMSWLEAPDERNCVRIACNARMPAKYVRNVSAGVGNISLAILPNQMSHCPSPCLEEAAAASDYKLPPILFSSPPPRSQ